MTDPDPDGDVRAFFTATTEIDRDAFGLTWNQATASESVEDSEDRSIWRWTVDVRGGP